MKITIITVCLNSAKTIAQTIKSVRDQQYDEIEYIVIDGGSTDGTLDIIRENEDIISYWISEPDRGLYDAMNKGIKLARGELTMFLNSDDWYDNNAISCIMDIYGKEKPDVICGGITVIEKNGDRRVDKIKREELKNFYIKFPIFHPATAVRTEILRENPFDIKYKVSADYKQLLQLYDQGRFFYITDENITFYRGTGLSFQRRDLGTREDYSISNDFLNRDVSLEKNFREKVDTQYWFHIFIENMDKPESLTYRCNWLKRKINGMILIYGAGYYGRICLDVLSEAESRIAGFIDRDPLKTGCIIDNTPVMNLEEIKDFDGMIIVAVRWHEDTVIEQLKAYGFKDEKIMNFFLLMAEMEMSRCL